MEQQTEDAPLAVLPQTITVGGRTFNTSTDTTYEQDLYAIQLMADAGLGDIAAEFQSGNGRYELDKLSEQLIIAAFRSGKIWNLLGAVLEEPGVPWTQERAEANGVFLSQLRTRQEKAKLHGSIAGIVLSFFVSGLLSLRTSQKSSGVTVSPSQPPESYGSSSSASALSQEDVVNLVYGAGSSANLPAGIPDDTPPS